MSVCDGKVNGRMRIGWTQNLVVVPHLGQHAVFHREDYESDESAEDDPDDAASSCGTAEREPSAPPTQLELEASSRRRLLNGNVDKYVELVIVNDFALCSAFLAADPPETLDDMTTRSAVIVAMIDDFYNRAFLHPTHCNALDSPASCPSFVYHIHMVLVAQVSFTSGDPYVVPLNPVGTADNTVLLSRFRAWGVDARNTGLITQNMDHWHLFSGLDGDNAGAAYTGKMCSLSNSCGLTGVLPDGVRYAHEKFATDESFAHVVRRTPLPLPLSLSPARSLVN